MRFELVSWEKFWSVCEEGLWQVRRTVIPFLALIAISLLAIWGANLDKYRRRERAVNEVHLYNDTLTGYETGSIPKFERREDTLFMRLLPDFVQAETFGERRRWFNRLVDDEDDRLSRVAVPKTVLEAFDAPTGQISPANRLRRILTWRGGTLHHRAGHSGFYPSRPVAEATYAFLEHRSVRRSVPTGPVPQTPYWPAAMGELLIALLVTSGVVAREYLNGGVRERDQMICLLPANPLGWLLVLVFLPGFLGVWALVAIRTFITGTKSTLRRLLVDTDIRQVLTKRTAQRQATKMQTPAQRVLEDVLRCEEELKHLRERTETVTDPTERQTALAKIASAEATLARARASRLKTWEERQSSGGAPSRRDLNKEIDDLTTKIDGLAEAESVDLQK